MLLTLVDLSFFSHCSLSFSISVTLNRRSLTSWYNPWGGKRLHYPQAQGVSWEFWSKRWGCFCGVKNPQWGTKDYLEREKENPTPTWRQILDFEESVMVNYHYNCFYVTDNTYSCTLEQLPYRRSTQEICIIIKQECATWFTTHTFRQE